MAKANLKGPAGRQPGEDPGEPTRPKSKPFPGLTRSAQMEKKRELWHVAPGPHENLQNADRLSGDCTRIYGDASEIEGEIGRLLGDVTGIRGNVTGVVGDLDRCRLSPEDRAAGVDIDDLVGRLH